MATAAEREARKANAEPAVSILLVDDNPANLLSLRALLDDLGQNLVEARSGDEALELVKKDDFAVVLLDVIMPGTSGFETAKLLRRNERSRHTPIIFLTAYDASRPQLEEGYALGAVDFLVKPFVPMVLRAKVQGFIDLFQDKQRTLREAEQLRLIVHGTTDYAIFMLDPEGKVATWNSGAERLKGYKAEEIIGQHFSKFYPQEAIDRGWPDYELKVARAEGRFEDEGWRLRKDGSRFWANVVITALRDEQGNMRGFSKVTRDLTDRKKAEEELRRSEERFRMLVEGARDYAIYLLDPHGHVMTWNLGAERIKGYKADEIIGQHFSRFYPQEAIDRRWPEHELTVAAAEGRFEDEGWRVRKDGTKFWANVVITALRDERGNLTGFSKITRDMTEQKRAEENALRLHEESTARRVAEENDRRKDEFLATLAHELRNPLAPIRNSLQILKMSRVDAATAQQTREMMERQVQHLVRLVDDLLDVSRVMRGKIELRREPVEMAAVIARAVETANPLIEAQGHELNIAVGDESMLLDVDPVRVAQVISNLLTNAAKYTEPNGQISLSAEKERDFAQLTVRDSGIGIAPDMLPHVFDLFVQADTASTRAQGGLGIGLTLVKNLVELHGGSVDATSAGLGRGSEFTVRLPLAKPKQTSLIPSDSGAHRLAAVPSGYRILVVDDNKDAATSLSFLLRLQGHEVRLAYDGATSLETAKEFHPHMIFLDLGMPGMDGYEVARRIRATPELRDIVLTALTGWGQKEDRQRTAAAGFDHHLVKPPEPKTIESLFADLKRTTG